MVRDYLAGCDTRRGTDEILFRALTPSGEDDRARLRSRLDEWRRIMRWAVRATHASNDGSNRWARIEIVSVIAPRGELSG